MTVSEQARWLEANQLFLTKALARLRGLLENGRPQPSPAEDLGWDSPVPPALWSLRARFGLSDFEADLLLLCAGVELDSRLAALCAAAQGEGGRPAPTFSLALSTLPGSHWSAH